MFEEFSLNERNINFNIIRYIKLFFSIYNIYDSKNPIYLTTFSFCITILLYYLQSNTIHSVLKLKLLKREK